MFDFKSQIPIVEDNQIKTPISPSLMQYHYLTWSIYLYNTLFIFLLISFVAETLEIKLIETKLSLVHLNVTQYLNITYA